MPANHHSSGRIKITRNIEHTKQVFLPASTAVRKTCFLSKTKTESFELRFFRTSI